MVDQPTMSTRKFKKKAKRNFYNRDEKNIIFMSQGFFKDIVLKFRNEFTFFYIVFKIMYFYSNRIYKLKQVLEKFTSNSIFWL